MHFFYEKKDIWQQKELMEELIFPGAEFAHILYEKMGQTSPNIKLASFNGIKNGEPIQIFCLANQDEDGEFNSFITAKGHRGISKFIFQDFEQKYGISNISLNILQEPNSLIPHLKPETYQKAKEILTDFYQVGLDTITYDRENNSYRLVIVSNADMTIGEHLVVDELTLFQGNKKVGYLKAKYTTPELMEMHEIPKDKKDLFKNEATVDYSRLLPEFMNKGLGYIMYFHMAQHLNEKGVEFRQSTVCSDQAQRLWKGIETHWENNTRQEKKKTFNKSVKVSFLSIGKDAVLAFENNQPKIKLR